MTSKRFEIERVSVTCRRPFEAVLEALRSAIARPDLGEIVRTIKSAPTFADMQNALEQRIGSTGLMLFLELDLGEVLRRETQRDSPRVVRFLIGNPLIMKEMVRHVPDAGSYAPVTVLLDERSDGVYLTYDRMSSFLAPYGNAESIAIAKELDEKIIGLLHRVAAQ